MSGVDAVELAVFQSAVHSIAEEMGAALRRTARTASRRKKPSFTAPGPGVGWTARAGAGPGRA